MRAHQPGSTPIDIPETVPNPAHTPAPAPAPAPERAPTKPPDKVPEKVIAPASFDAFFSDQARDMAHASVSRSLGAGRRIAQARLLLACRGCEWRQCERAGFLSFPKIISARIGAMRQNHRMIRCDGSSACSRGLYSAVGYGAGECLL
jgi:hypothetical protein